MTIAIDIRSLLDESGGVGTYTRSIVDGVLSLSSDHQFVLFSNSFRRTSHTLPDRWRLRATIAEFSYPNKMFNASLCGRGQPYVDELIADKTGLSIDVFFAPNCNFLALSNRVKFVATAHDLSFEISPERLRVKDRLWHRLVSPRTLFSRADKIIAVSHATRRDLESLYGIAAQKISVTHLAAHDAPKDGTIPSRESLGLPTHFIFGLGSGQRKNLEGLIDAYAHLVTAIGQRAPELVLGGLRGADIVRLSRHAERVGIADHVHLEGYIPIAYLFAYYAHAELFVYPSFTEGFGIPPLEAARAKTPVIATLAGSIGEVMGEAACLVDPYSPEQIARMMRLLLEDHDARTYYTEAGFRRVERYSWIICAEQTLKILESV